MGPLLDADEAEGVAADSSDGVFEDVAADAAFEVFADVVFVFEDAFGFAF